MWSSADGKEELTLTMRSAPPLAALVVPDGGPGVLATTRRRPRSARPATAATNILTWSNVLGLCRSAQQARRTTTSGALLAQQDTVQCDGSGQMLPWLRTAA